MALRDLEPVPLKRWQAERFLDQLAAEPFMCMVVEEGGEVHLYSCGLEPEHLDRIREHLMQVTTEKEADGDGQG